MTAICLYRSIYPFVICNYKNTKKNIKLCLWKNILFEILAKPFNNWKDIQQ